MSDDVDVIEEEVSIIEDEVVPDEVAPEEEESEDTPEEDEFSVTIGDEEEEDAPEEGEEDNEEPKDSSVLKKMRNLYKEEKKKNRALKQKMDEATPPPVVENMDRIKKPSLDDEDIDYDKEVYESRLKEYFQSESKHEKLEEEAKKQQVEAQEAWQSKLDNYNDKKNQLDAEDYEDAEEFVKESLSEVQQNVILQYAKDSALLVYALGKNKKKAQELAKITDPVEFVIQARELESKLKVRNKRITPSPEKTVKGSSRAGKTSNETLESLRAKAAKTGIYTELSAYKRKLKQQQG